MTRTPRIAILTAAAVCAALAAAIAMAAGGGDSTSDATGATAKYYNLTVAKHAGYGLLKDKQGIACIAMDSMPAMGAMGVHYAKGALVADGKVSPNTPEALVYAPIGKKLNLAAVEYVVIKSAWDAKHASAPVLFGHRFNFTPAGNRFGLPAYYSLHVWLFKHNPAGEFSMWNPEVHCK
jgi:hypothetical protein